MRFGKPLVAALLLTLVSTLSASSVAQRRTSETARGDRRGVVSAVTIPVTVRLQEKPEPQTELKVLDVFTVFEDGEPQEILTTRGAPVAPLTLAVLVQDDLVSTVGSEIDDLARFIRRLPSGSRVMVGYLRSGSLQVRQRFTTDLERAAKSLRIPAASPAVAPYNPFTLTRDALKRFESQPIGRRAVLLISDGIDVSRGIENSTPTQSVDLQRTITEAQRRSVAVYSVYAPTVGGTNRMLVGNGQSSLNRLSKETGGRPFIQGTDAPVSFAPYLRELDTLLSRQFALTYLSTHPEKGFHNIRIVADLTEGEIHYPAGYTR